MMARKERWICVRWTYSMDAADSLHDPKAVPKLGSLTMCLNCGGIYIMRKKWKPLTAKQLERLPKRLKAEIAIVQRARQKIITEDLAFNQKLREAK